MHSHNTKKWEQQQWKCYGLFGHRSLETQPTIKDVKYYPPSSYIWYWSRFLLDKKIWAFLRSLNHPIRIHFGFTDRQNQQTRTNFVCPPMDSEAWLNINPASYIPQICRQTLWPEVTSTPGSLDRHGMQHLWTWNERLHVTREGVCSLWRLALSSRPTKTTINNKSRTWFKLIDA